MPSSSIQSRSPWPSGTSWAAWLAPARRASASRAAQEVPLGHGDLDWVELLGVLEEVEYRGWLTVERETGANPFADVAAGVQFLRRLVG